jgi:CRISPR-associated protein Cmr4
MHRLFTLIAHSHLHPGEGKARAAVDQPIARESVSGMPFVPGHSAKGAIKAGVFARQIGTQNGRVPGGADAGATPEDHLFGNPLTTGSGALLVNEFRLVLLPLRATGYPFVLGTTTYLLDRLANDLDFAEQGSVAADLRSRIAGIRQLQSGVALTPTSIDDVHGFRFSRRGAEDDERLRTDLASAISTLLGIPTELDLAATLAVFNIADFRHLTEVALPVRARNALDPNKISQALWYEETLPPDTVMTALIGRRGMVPDPSVEENSDASFVDPVDVALEKLKSTTSGRHYLQVGGNETVGQGLLQIIEAPCLLPAAAAPGS